MDILIGNLVQFFTLLIIVDVLLGYFMDPYHPVRQALDSIVEPMLSPIRNMMPYMGGIDFSPLILILLLQLLGSLLISLF